MDALLDILVSDPNRTNAIAAAANVVVAGVALLVAAVSIFLSWRALAAQTRHNQLSLSPLPFTAVADYEDRIWVKVVNNGTGPLIVLSTEVYGAGKSTASLIEQMPPLPSDLYWTSFTSGMKGRSIPQNGELYFIDLKIDPSNPKYIKFRDACRNKLAALTVKVEFTDVYGNRFDPAIRKLDWFARQKSNQYPE